MSNPATLNVYSLVQHPLRSTAHDHLYALRRHGRGTQVYLNLGVRKVPRWIARASWDAVVFHTTFFSHRWAPGAFEAQIAAAEPLRGLGEVKVALPQDEHVRTALLRKFIEEFEIDHVFSLAAESEWGKIYEGVDRERVGFSTALPGYLSDDTRERIERIVEDGGERSVDIGYRAWKGAPWLGRHGVLKYEVGARVAEAAPAHGVSTDISSSDDDVLTGDDWFRFLACVQVHARGRGRREPDRRGRQPPGAGRAVRRRAPDGRLRRDRVRLLPGRGRRGELLRDRPPPHRGLRDADLPGPDRGRPTRACCARASTTSRCAPTSPTSTRCWRPCGSDEERERITEAAYRDVIASDRYTYARLVEEIEAVTLAGVSGGGGPARRGSPPRGPGSPTASRGGA